MYVVQIWVWVYQTYAIYNRKINCIVIYYKQTTHIYTMTIYSRYRATSNNTVKQMFSRENKLAKSYTN
jgi:hypothetical protein